MKKLNVTLLGILCSLAMGTAHSQTQKIDALEAFKNCDAKAMPKAPVTLPGGLVIKKIATSNSGMGQRVQLTFNKKANPNNENQAGMVKRLTGYDFTDLDTYEIDEASGAPWIACTKKK